ncbi:SAV_2336 N-terminal domain-related protein [Streptomyces sp. NPDC057677]|uniref:SAV_2336 N-terminal domain-related protein n=1 Tax=unclassified Streptomyces TaxID=2593676 RepID=UPI00368FCC15
MSEALDRLLRAWVNLPTPHGAEATVLADALWLAATGTPSAGATQVTDGLPDRVTAEPEPDEASSTGAGAPPDRRAAVHRRETRDLSVRGAGSASTVRGVPISLGRADPLPDALAVGRAIQPFRRPWPRGGRDRLDVDATVEHYARGGPLVPLFRPAPEPWFEMVVLVDSSLSMSVWEETSRALTRLLTTLGGFRTVHTWRLAWEEGGPVVRDHHGHEVPGGRVPHHGGGPRGRRMVLMVSDCAARGWHAPEPWLLLREWGERIPVALLDPLPPRLWRRSALNLPAVRVTAGRAGARNSALRHTLPPRLRPPVTGADPTGPWTALPVVSCTPRSLGAWASTLMRADPRGCDAVLIPATGRHSPPRDGTAPTRRPDPARLAEAFTRTAPTPAVRLAVLCSSLPELPLPLLHVLRDQAVPEARYADLAELLTSGLFAVRRDTGGDPVLALHSEAREHLRTHLTTHDTWLTKAALSRHAAAHPHAPQGITAVLHDALAGAEIQAEPGAFAEKDVLVRLAGTAAREALDEARGEPPEEHRPGTVRGEEATAEAPEDPAEGLADPFAAVQHLRSFLESTPEYRGTRHAETLLRHLITYLISRLPAPWGDWPGRDTCFDDLRAAKGLLTPADVLDDLADRDSLEGVNLVKPGPGTSDTGQDLVWKTPDGVLSVELKSVTSFSWSHVTQAVQSGTTPSSPSGSPVSFLLLLDESDKPEGLHAPASCVRLIRREGTQSRTAVVVLRLQTRYRRAPRLSRAELTDHLVTLRRLAGFPAYEELAREATAASPPVPLDVETLTEWFHGHAVPADEQAFEWLTGFLVRQAGLTEDAAWSSHRLAALRHHALVEERRGESPRSERPGRPVAEATGDAPDPYVGPPHEPQLRFVIQDFVAGTGRLVLVIGAPGSSRILSSLEAMSLLPAGYQVWEPPTPAVLAAELDAPSSTGPRTIVRLDDAARHFLDVSDGGLGERISTTLRARLHRTDSDPVLVLGLLTPEAWGLLETPPPTGAPDPHAQARALCREALHVWMARTPGERWIRRYLSAEAPSRALLDAAIDARRYGHGPRLPLALLSEATPHYLPARERHRSDGWFMSALFSLSANVEDGAALLSRANSSAYETEGGDSQLPAHYVLSDSIEQYGSAVRDGTEPPQGLWNALAAHASRRDLEAIALAAHERGDTERAELFDALAHPTPRAEETLTLHDIAAPALRRLLRSTDLSEGDAAATVDRALEWLRVDSLAEEAQFVLNGLLSRTGLSHQVRSEAAARALDWLDVHGTAQAAEFVIGPLLALSGLSGEQEAAAVDHALAWLDFHGRGDSAQFVLRPLLLRGDLSQEQIRVVESHASGWLQGREADVQSQFALSAVLRRVDLDRAARDEFLQVAFHWLRAVGGHASAKFVLRPLLQRADLAPAEVRVSAAFALAWLEEHGAVREAQFVLSALLHRGDLDLEEVEVAADFALAWLSPRTADRTARFVLFPLLERTDLNQEVRVEAMELGRAWSLDRVARGEPDHGVKALVDRLAQHEERAGCLIMIMDVVGLSGRTLPTQEHALRALRDLVSRVLPDEDAALRESWSTGDGMVVLFPMGAPDGDLVPRTLMRVERALHDHDSFGSLRLRVALHYGTVERSGMGWSGSGLVTAARLVESAPLRATMEAGSRARAAVAISESLFLRVFAAETDSAGTFRPVFFETKQGVEKAWISTAGYPEPPGIHAWTRLPGKRR